MGTACSYPPRDAPCVCFGGGEVSADDKAATDRGAPGLNWLPTDGDEKVTGTPLPQALLQPDDAPVEDGTVDPSKSVEVAQIDCVLRDHNLAVTPSEEDEGLKTKSVIDQAVERARHEEQERVRFEYEEKAIVKSEAEFKAAILKSQQSMMIDPNTLVPGSKQPNRYGTHAQLPPFEEGKHVPVLALINPMSGAAAGTDILNVARQTPYYQRRFFNIIDVVKSKSRRGGLLDVFRLELNAAKEEAKKLGTRPRLVSGGGDGTGSFALFIIFSALRADNGRAIDGLGESASRNGFIWTDEELAESFPAIAQMPLGSANDFGHILGWGEKYPGDPGHSPCPCTSRNKMLSALQRWISSIIDPRSQVVNFDVWGIMPPDGQTACDFKLAELSGRRGRCPNEKGNLKLKLAGKPVPFFVCLYFSCGFGAYMTARFQLNRRRTPVKNRLEYTRQALGIILERTPKQMHARLDGVKFESGGEAYFPPRNRRGRGYREVGFYNINWQAKALHGYDRASACTRLNPFNKRRPVSFNDGKIDLFRWKFLSLLKNPGLKIQTDKRKDLQFTYDGGKGKGIFFQWDGEARFAFSPSGDPFHMFIRRVMTIPVVLGPSVDQSLTGNLENGFPVRFDLCGNTDEEKDLVRQRILRSVAGELDGELNATEAEIRNAGFHM